jgi:hypothetical protein
MKRIRIKQKLVDLVYNTDNNNLIKKIDKKLSNCTKNNIFVKDLKNK